MAREINLEKFLREEVFETYIVILAEEYGLDTTGEKKDLIKKIISEILPKDILSVCLRAGKLKEILEEHGLPKNGNKDELVERVLSLIEIPKVKPEKEKIKSSKYWKQVKINDWRDRLHEVETRAGTNPFSIVYRFYSTKSGRVRYVGRSDSPFNRQSSHISQIIKGMHNYLGGQISWVDFKYFTGPSRFKEAYEEECKQWHKHEPDLNTNHPQKIKHTSWKCPICKK